MIYLELEGNELINERGQPINMKKVAKAFHKMFFITLSVICVMVFYFSVLIVKNTVGISSQKMPAIKTTDKIAALKFGNNTGDSGLDIVGEMAAD